MTMQSDRESNRGFLHSVAGQMTLLGAAIVVLLVLAWLYVW